MKLTTILLLLCLSLPALAIRPTPGWWWNPNEPGSGLNLEIQDNVADAGITLFIAAFLYDEVGNATWFTMQGTYSELTRAEWNATQQSHVGTFASFLFASNGGPCLRCPYIEPGTQATQEQAELRFVDNRNLEITWGGRTVSMRRFEFSNGFAANADFLLGRWHLRGEYDDGAQLTNFISYFGDVDFAFFGQDPTAVKPGGVAIDLYADTELVYETESRMHSVASEGFANAQRYSQSDRLYIAYDPSTNRFFGDLGDRSSLGPQTISVDGNDPRFRLFVGPDRIDAWGIDSIDGNAQTSAIALARFVLRRTPTVEEFNPIPLAAPCRAVNTNTPDWIQFCEQLDQRFYQEFPDFVR